LSGRLRAALAGVQGLGHSGVGRVVWPLPSGGVGWVWSGRDLPFVAEQQQDR
jgi:hypothetical protein